MTVLTAHKAGVETQKVDLNEFIPMEKTMRVVRYLEESNADVEKVQIEKWDDEEEVVHFETRRYNWEITILNSKYGDDYFGVEIKETGEHHTRKTAHGVVDVMQRIEIENERIN